jgi:hypothetical protein
MKFTLSIDEAKRILRSHLSIANDVELVITIPRARQSKPPEIVLDKRPLPSLLSLLDALTPTKDGIRCLRFNGTYMDVDPIHKIAAIKGIRQWFYDNGFSCGLHEAKRFAERFPAFQEELKKPNWTIEKMFVSLK